MCVVGIEQVALAGGDEALLTFNPPSTSRRTKISGLLPLFFHFEDPPPTDDVADDSPEQVVKHFQHLVQSLRSQLNIKEQQVTALEGAQGRLESEIAVLKEDMADVAAELRGKSTELTKCRKEKRESEERSQNMVRGTTSNPCAYMSTKLCRR